MFNLFLIFFFNLNYEIKKKIIYSILKGNDQAFCNPNDLILLINLIMHLKVFQTANIFLILIHIYIDIYVCIVIYINTRILN